MKHQILTMLAKLNPSRSLFGKLFLWFWLATIVLVSSTIWLSQQFNNDAQLRPISQKHQAVLNKAVDHIESIDRKRRKFRDLDKLAYHLNRKTKHGVVIYNADTKSWHSDIPGPKFNGQKRFEKVMRFDGGFTFNVGRFEFSGPAITQFSQDTIYVFIGHHRKGGLIHNFRENHPVAFVSCILAISALLCFFMAWRLNKPLKQLQKTVGKMATGDLSARVANADKRHDEFGQLSQDINHMAEQVENLVDSQKRLLADISHELRSPLARLQMAIGIAQQSAEDNNLTADSQTESLTRIEKEANEIEAMITQVLALSRLEAKTQQAVIEPVNVSSLIEQIVQDARFEASGCGKVLNTEIASAIQISGDGQLLSRAFENLIRNAVKYAESVVYVTLATTEQGLVFTVRDDGDGVPEQELEQIFTPFYRTSTSRNRQSGGIGLGLAITRSAIQLHQGQITARNARPNGLNVEVILPMSL